MGELLQSQMCNQDGCALAPANVAEQHASVATESKRVEVSIISDAICPWCYVAKRRFEKAVAGLHGEISVAVKWLPLELNPQIPPEGLDRKQYRSRKFGSWEQSLKLDAEVAQVGALEGINFRHDLALRTPNTLLAHRLIWRAEKNRLQDEVVEALFLAYFTEGLDIGDAAIVADIATACGMDRAAVAAFLESDEGSAEVSQAEFTAAAQGIAGVPTFVFNGEPAFLGAQRTELMVAHLMSAAGLK
jgi:predicted DsbA family dithiol-disulfide isomerase